MSARPRLGAFVFAIAVLPNLFALSLPFALDDYNILKDVGRILEFDPPPHGTYYFFRPTVWVLWAVLIKLGGGMASAPLFHAVLLALHGLTAWLLFRVLRSFVDERAAFAGAALFGLMPGGIQAVTWVAAAGDQVALLFLLCGVLGAQRFARTGRPAAILAIAACTFLSFLAKETMVVLAPAAALGIWSVPREERRDRRWWIPMIAAVLGIAAGGLARWMNLGILGPAYAYDVSLNASKLARMHQPFLQMIVPWNQSPAFAGMGPGAGVFLGGLFGGSPVRANQMAVLIALGIPVALGLLQNPRSLPRALAVLAAFLIALLPAVGAWRVDEAPSNTLSRVFYGPLAIFCTLIAVSIRPWRVVIGISILVLALLEFDLSMHVARTELFVAARIDSRLDSLQQVARAEGPGTVLLAVDGEDGIGGIPLTYAGIAWAMSRPFSTMDRTVSWWPDAATLDRSPALRSGSGPIRVLEIRDGRFVPVGGLVSPVPSKLAPIELGVPPARHTLALGDPLEIPFSVPFDSPSYRITVDVMIAQVRLPIVYTVPRERLGRLPGGKYRFAPAAGDRIEWPGHAYHVTWNELPEAFRREVASRGVHSVAIQVRVEGLSADGVTPEAESAWDTLTLLEK